MKKAAFLLAFLVFFASTFPISVSADDTFTQGYFTYSFPAEFGYTSSDNLSAYSQDGIIYLTYLDLDTVGMPVSSDIMGEQATLESLMEISYSEQGWAVYETGERDGAAYIIGTVDYSTDGSTVKMTAFGLLKKNKMLYGMVYETSIQRARLVASSFINGVTINDQLQDIEEDAPLFPWEISDTSESTTVTFEAVSEEISISFPKSFEIFMPGMGDESPVPHFLGYTPKEMEDFIKGINATGVYVFAVDMERIASLRVNVSDIEGKLGKLPPSGKYNEKTLYSYFDGVAITQGNYEVRRVDDRLFFSFPNYSNGYKIRSIFGTTEVTLLLSNQDNTFTDVQLDELWSIAQSVVLAGDSSSSISKSYFSTDDVLPIYIDDINMHISMPSSWYVFTQNMSEGDFVRVNQEIQLYDGSYEDFKTSLSKSGILLDALDSSKWNELTIVTSKTIFHDFTDYTYSELTTFMESMIQETKGVYSVISSEIISIDSTPFFKVVSSVLGSDTYAIQYYTIINRKAICINYFSDDGLIDATEMSFIDNLLQLITFS